MPTVLALAGIASPTNDGVSLVDLMTGRRHGLDLEAYAESLYPQRFGWSPLYALRDSRYKFIDAPKPELYDLVRDPFEERNIVAERPTIAAAMKRRLDAIASQTPSEDHHASAATSPETRQRLISLGYVTGPRASTPTGGRLPDPKDCLPPLGRPVPGRCAH
jgi:arylsulfatase A-like enzyme